MTEVQNAAIASLRQMTFKEINPSLASMICAKYHSVLPNIHPSNIWRNRHYICFGLFFEGLAVATAIYSSPVNRHLDNGETIELRRLAISDHCPKNTATWFMAKCEKLIKAHFKSIKKMISYQDKSAHLGTIYKAGNWEIDGETKFVDWGVSRKRAKAQSTSGKVRWAKNLGIKND